MNLKTIIIAVYWFFLVMLFFDMRQGLSGSFEDTFLFVTDGVTPTMRVFLYLAFALMPVFIWFCVDEFLINPKPNHDFEEENEE